MFDLTKLTSNPETKKVLFFSGLVITALIGIHYYKQIQLTDAKLEKLRESQDIQ